MEYYNSKHNYDHYIQNESDWIQKSIKEIKSNDRKFSSIHLPIDEYCSICEDGLHNLFDNDTFVKPHILYKMKFPLGIVIPKGLTDKNKICFDCGKWIDFIYKMQNRVGRNTKARIKYDKARRYNKQYHIFESMIMKKETILNNLMNEIRELEDGKTNSRKEELKKKLLEISNKIEKMESELVKEYSICDKLVGKMI